MTHERFWSDHRTWPVCTVDKCLVPAILLIGRCKAPFCWACAFASKPEPSVYEWIKGDDIGGVAS